MNSTPQSRLDRAGHNRWRILPYLLPLIVLIALSTIVYASGQRVLGTAEALMLEDAAMMNWWQTDQREQLNSAAGMLAARMSDEEDLSALANAIGLADFPGYVAWIDGQKAERQALNPGGIIGQPATNKLFSFAPAVGKPSVDFWHENGQAYWMSMAPVSPDKGGGVIVIQKAIDEDMLDELSALTGRDVLFYSYADKQPLLGSDAALLENPPALSDSWLETVASGQLPDATTAQNAQGDLIVGMTAFSDFAGISYSGYLSLIEQTRNVSEIIPQSFYWGLALLATLIMLIGAVVLDRMVGSSLENRHKIKRKTQRSVKWRMVLVTGLFLLPTLLAAGYIMMQTSNRSATLDLRTAQVAKDVLIDSVKNITARVNGFASSGTAQSLGAGLDADGLAATLQQAHGLEFAIVEENGELTQAGNEELSPDMLAALAQIETGTTQVVQSGRTVMLAGRQAGPDGVSTIGGMRLNKVLPNITDIAPADLTLLRGKEPWVTTLAEREIDSIYFDAPVEEELAANGEASYLQKVGWNPGKVTIANIQLGDSDLWRLVVSQASVIWSNSVRTFQGFGWAILATALVLISVILLTLLNLDQPLLLRRMYTGYLFILPAVIWLVWWQLGPALFAGYLSFHKWSVLSPAKPFVGLHNYRQIWQDDVFWRAMKNTFIYVTQIPLGMALALALAMALNRPLRGIRALRTIYYMPAVTSVVVVSLMWKLLYNKDFGIFNYLLEFLGLGPYGFLQSTTMAMPSIMGMAVWLGLGARMILFLAGLQSIPNDFYEAADVDGAGRWNKFRHITIPLLAPTTFFVFITSIINSFQVFGPIYVLTEGGPVGATDVAVYRIYFEAWSNLRFGYASAETVILFAFLFVVTAIQFRYFGRNVSYG